MIQHDMLNRFTGNVQFTAEIDCNENEFVFIKRGLSVLWALKNNANLVGADLEGAYLAGATLAGANLEGANLAGANLMNADLEGANLEGANLVGANLEGADLEGADLAGSNLRGANLRDANLGGADLRNANLGNANLRSFKSCLWMTLTENPHEVFGVAQALKEGRVDGSAYSGECACLIGTIANIKDVDYSELNQNESNPSERWFMMIKKGDVPGHSSGGSFAAKLALQWVEEWLSLQNMDLNVA